MARTDGRNVNPGDLIRLERRYVVDGQVTSLTDSGTFLGVASVGSIEHLVIDDVEERRMIPLESVSEIQVLDGTSEAAPDETDTYIR